MVRALDLKSGVPGFKSRSDSYLELFLGSSKLNSSAALVNSQLVCLLLGFLTVLFSIFIISLSSLMLGPTGTCVINTAEGK